MAFTFEAAKELARLVLEAGKMDLYQKAIDLQVQVGELVTENIDVKQQVTDLKKQLEIRGKVRYDAFTHTYRLDGHGAYCATCYDQHGALQHLHPFSFINVQGQTPEKLHVKFRCHRCKWESAAPCQITKEELQWKSTYADPPVSPTVQRALDSPVRADLRAETRT